MGLYNEENASPTIMNSFAVELKKGKIVERHAIAPKLVIEKTSLKKVSCFYWTKRGRSKRDSESDNLKFKTGTCV